MEPWDAPLGAGRGVLNGALVCEYGACEKSGAAVGVEGALASLEFVSLGSIPWLPVDELGCAHSLPSRHWSG